MGQVAVGLKVVEAMVLWAACLAALALIFFVYCVCNTLYTSV